MGPERVPNPPTAATSSTRLTPESGSWWDYVDSRNRTGERSKAGTQSSEHVFSDAFVMHMRNLMRAPTLDVDVVSHCNLNCASCCHFSPAASPAFLSLEDYKRDLGKLARIEGLATFFDAIVLMGGEPLLHPGLPELIWATRRHLPELQLRVASNGLLLKSMGSEFWDAMRAADCKLVLTLYPTGLDYEALFELARAHGVKTGISGGVAESGVVSRLLRTPLDVEGLQDPTTSFNGCPLGGFSLQLLDGKIFPCNRGALLGIANERFGTTFAHEVDDYLKLDAIRSVEDIDSMRRRAHPMCRYCVTSLDERIEWRRSAVEPGEWLMRPDERKLMK